METEALKYLPVQNDSYLHSGSVSHSEGKQKKISQVIGNHKNYK
jgi:hypothetical protein